MSDLDTIRERHQEAVWEDYTTKPPTLKHTGECVADDQPWPCDFALAIEALDEAQEMERQALIQQGIHEGAAIAARALADELAEALLRASRYIDPHYHGLRWDEREDEQELTEAIDTALAKWEASK